MGGGFVLGRRFGDGSFAGSHALYALLTDEEAERFVAEADLSGFKLMRFEFASRDGRVNIRLPRDLLAAAKKRAERRCLPYQRYARRWNELSLPMIPNSSPSFSIVPRISPPILRWREKAI